MEIESIISVHIILLSKPPRLALSLPCVNNNFAYCKELCIHIKQRGGGELRDKANQAAFQV
jgi:hypothetical protein